MQTILLTAVKEKNNGGASARDYSFRNVLAENLFFGLEISYWEELGDMLQTFFIAFF